MKISVDWKKVKKVVKGSFGAALFLIWSIGMLLGGIYGLAAVAVGIPAVIGFTIFGL